MVWVTEILLRCARDSAEGVLRFDLAMVVIVLNIVAVVGLIRSIAVVAATQPDTGAGRARRTARAAPSRARIPHPAGGIRTGRRQRP